MPLSVTIPTLGKPKTVKDAVISILTSDWPLTARKIFIKVKNMNLDVSYQAVHKALNELIGEEVVRKTENKYQISQEWIERIREFGNQLDSSYKGQETASMEKVISTGYANFTLENLYECYKFLMDLFDNYLLDLTNEEDIAAIYFKNMYWVLSASNKEYDQFIRIVSSRKIFIICNGNTYADKMLAKFFSIFKAVVNLGVNYHSDCDFFVGGDYIVQIYFPENIRNMIKDAYKDIKDTSILKKFYDNTFHKKTEINVIVMKNPKLAVQLRNNVIKYFNNRRIE